MNADTVVRARIDSDTKARAAEALHDMGLTVSDAIRLLLLRVADEGRGKRFASAEELFEDIGA